MTPTEFVYFLRTRTSRRNLRLLLRILLALVVLITVYSVIFYLLMGREGQDYSLVTSVYWTITIMSTLGLGDISFSSDLGRVFSLLVLASGMFFLFILLPFAFVQFFQSGARAPRELPRDTSGHVVLTHFDPITDNLIDKLTQYRYPYVLVVPNVEEGLRLYDQGLRVMVGPLDDPETYRKVRIGQAAMVVTTASDPVSTIVTFTVRAHSDTVPVITVAHSAASVDIMQLAGSTHVLQLEEMMGQTLARRTIGGDAITHVIGQFDQLLIAEATAIGTPLVGQTLQESRLRELIGVTVIGIWERGLFTPAHAQTHITSQTVLVLAGTKEQLQTYDELFAIYHVVDAPVVIIGGGRVGSATGRALGERGVDYRIVERDVDRVRNMEKYVPGDAAELDILERAGFQESGAVVITTHDDEVNVYLTLYCRRLRPDIQIISRTMHERNVATLHRAGADFVVSESTMGANTIFNLLKRNDILMVTEGIDIFRLPIPSSLAGKTIAETEITQETGCYITAVYENGVMHVNPGASMRLPAESEIILIGAVEAENKFLEMYGGK